MNVLNAPPPPKIKTKRKKTIDDTNDYLDDDLVRINATTPDLSKAFTSPADSKMISGI